VHSDSERYVVEPIGVVRSPRTEPRDDDWGEIEATIELGREVVGPQSLKGLEEFSHVEVVYLFHLVEPGSYERNARRPRGNPEWPEVGIYAQRAKRRPNRIGISVCELLGIDGTTLSVRGLDAIDGTPVLDLKPHMTEFAPRGEVRQPQWSRQLMDGYW
jgi:tRNA-Thr(GGU) m(6)t(6)A37 methyltransferase TsaA